MTAPEMRKARHPVAVFRGEVKVRLCYTLFADMTDAFTPSPCSPWGDGGTYGGVRAACPLKAFCLHSYPIYPEMPEAHIILAEGGYSTRDGRAANTKIVHQGMDVESRRSGAQRQPGRQRRSNCGGISQIRHTHIWKLWATGTGMPSDN